MPEPDLSLLFLRPLNQLAVKYVISGSVAAILYGEPRLTHDVDLVVLLHGEDVVRLVAAFPSPEFYLPPPEVIHAELAREQRGHFNVIHADTGFKADFYYEELRKLASARMAHVPPGQKRIGQDQRAGQH